MAHQAIPSRKNDQRIGTASPARLRVGTEGAVSAVLIVSGAAGLIFELVWLYRCGLVFGNSTWAAAIVVASFMGGLAVGNALVAVYGSRIRRPLHTYAALEVSTAVCGLAVTYALPHITPALIIVTRSLAENLWLTNAVRLFTAFGVLVWPTAAMGATLPLLVGAVTRSHPAFGRALGRLYGWNTIGAVVGVLAAEVFLIPRFGVRGTAWIAAMFDLSVAAAVGLLITRRVESRPSDHQAPPRASPGTFQWGLPTSAFLAGAALMALEIIWLRFLSMLIASNTLAMSLVLATLLTAIGLGGLAAGRWLDRRPNATERLPAIAFTTACAVIGSYWSFQFVTADSRALDWPRIVWFACSLSFPASLLSGVIFTLLGDALKGDVASEASAAGWLILANGTGAMTGAICATFVLLPLFGMERSIFLLAVLYVMIGVLLIRTARTRRPRAALWPTGAAGSIAVFAVALFPFGLMSETYFARALQPHTADGATVVATREGTADTIFLTRVGPAEAPGYYRLVTNGISMSATTLKARRYMRYFVYLPMLLHEAPLRRVLVVGYGVGITAGAVRDIQSVESIEVAEISRDIVAMSGLIHPPDDDPLHDPRVRLHVEDGRYFLQATVGSFDLITGEPPPPLTPGAVNIYTHDYFQLVYERLADRGIATYWLPVARLAGTDHATIIRAFCEVFEDCSLWNGTPADLLLMGTRQGSRPVSATRLQKAWDEDGLGVHMREIGLERPEQIGATFIGDAAYLRPLVADALPLTDDYPRRLRVPIGIALSDPRRRLDSDTTTFYREMLDHRRAQVAFENSALARRLWPEALLNDTRSYFEVQGIINRVLTEGANPLGRIEDLHMVLTRTPLQRLVYWLLGFADDPTVEHASGMQNDRSGRIEYLRGLRELVERDYGAAARYFAQAEQRGLRSVRPLLVYALCLAGSMDDANELVQPLQPTNADQSHFRMWLNATFGLQLPP